MPSCGCKSHDAGEFTTSPVLKLSNKKVKKETIEKMKMNGLISKYCNYVCEACVNWVQTGGANRGLKRKKTIDVDEVVKYILEDDISDDEMNRIACALGDKITDHVFIDSSNVTNSYSPDNLIEFDLQKWLTNRNTVLVNFLLHTAKTTMDDTKKLICIGSSVESVYKARNLKTISPLAYSQNLVSYYMSQSKNIVALNNSCRPAGSYFTIKAWLSRVGAIPLENAKIKNQDTIIFFDNSQVIARNWRVNYNYKCKASVVTTTANIVLPSNLQLNPSLSPANWLYNGRSEEEVNLLISSHISLHKQEFKSIRNKWIHHRLQNAMNAELPPNDDPYEWVPDAHLDPQPDISIGDPVMCNPCSFDSVKKVLKEIKTTCGVSEGQKTWCVIGCDGLPYTLGTKLIEQNKDLQNILLIPGHGHIEMNAVKAVFKLLWDPALQDLARECGFKSPRAQVCAQSCSDHHKAYMLMLILFECVLQEILQSFVDIAEQGSIEVTVANFYLYIHNSKDKNFRFMCDVLLNYLLPIIIYRAGIRRNNYKYISAGKSQFYELFFAFGMKNYQKLIMKDIKSYVLAPPEVQEFLQKTQSFTVSGQHSKGEGGDFILEAMNARIKRWLPPGIPSEKHWTEVCRNADLLQKIREKTYKECDINDQQQNEVYTRNISTEIQQYRERLRQIGYLANNGTNETPHTSVSGDFLDQKLFLFERQIADNIENFMEHGNTEFTPVFTTTAQRTTFYSLEKKTRKQLAEIIEAGVTQVRENGDVEEAVVLADMWVKVKSRPKLELLQFYKEVTVALENSTSSTICSDDESSTEDEGF